MLSQTFCQSLPNFLQNGSKIAKFCLNFRPTFATATHLTSQINSKSIKAGSLSFENWAWFGLLSLRKWSYDFATWNRRVKSAESASPHSSPASNLEQRLGLRLSLKDLHRNFVQPCPNFYMGWKVRNLAHMLFSQSSLRRPAFRNESADSYLKSKPCILERRLLRGWWCTLSHSQSEES